MKKLYTLLMMCLLGTVVSWAETVTLSPVADTYFSWDATGDCYGTEETLYCGIAQEMWTNAVPGLKHGNAGSKNIAVFKFDASNYIGKITDATFKVTATNPSTNSNTRSIYLGYFDLTNWDETTTTANCGMVTRSATDLNIHPFNLSNSIAKGETKEVSFNSDGLKTYINSDADGIISLIVYGVGQQCTVNSKEAESGTPSLVIEYSNSTFYSVTFNEKNGLEPTVAVYSDEARSTSVSSDQLSANTTYYYTATLAGYENATGSFKVASADTTINITMTALERYTFTVNAVCGDDVVKTLYTDNDSYEGKKCSVAMPKYLTDDDNKVICTKSNDTYYTEFTSSANNATQTVSYVAYEGTAYFYEGESYNALGTKITSGNCSSNSAGRGLNNTTLDLCTVAEAGQYNVSYAICSNNVNAARTCSFYRNSSEYTLDTQSCTWSINYIKTTGSKSFEASFAAGDVLQMYSSDGNVILDYVLLERTGDAVEQITINEIGVSSYVTTYPLDFSTLTGLKALIATSETEDQIVMTKVTEVPANTPIIVRGTAGTYDIPVGTCTALSSTNLLKGSATESINAGDVEGTVYALKKADGEFHKVAATVTIPAKIAYFVSTATTAGAKEIKSYTIFGEEETAVSSVNADTEKANARLFNVAGQQVGAGYKGLVIDENGNKYIK